MKTNIRKAQKKDIKKISNLLSQVLELHAKIRPDIFISGTTKYTEDELNKIICDEKTPVFVAVNENDEVIGYAFCILKQQPFSTNMKDFQTLFVDDLCIDKNYRNAGIGKLLFNFVLEFAKKQNCYDVTLNVWEGNSSAKQFYEKMGMFIKETQMEIFVKYNDAYL